MIARFLQIVAGVAAAVALFAACMRIFCAIDDAWSRRRR